MEKGSFLSEFLAGNVGGLIGICVVYPLDTAKTRLQTYPHYKSTSDVIRSMIKADGVQSIYRGIPAPALGFGLTFAVSFRFVMSYTFFCIVLSLLIVVIDSAYGFCCRQISQYHQKDINKLSLTDMTIAGAITGVVQTPVRQVVERIKSVMQVREQPSGKGAYAWSGACFQELIRKEGWRNGLFQGMSSVFLREVPQFAVYYPCYEFTKVYLSQFIESQMLTQFLAGGIAGVVQWLPPIYFADVLKSKTQTAPAGYYKGAFDCFAKVYKEDGIRAFFRGLTPALFRAFPLHAIIFLGYETTMSFMKPTTKGIE